MEEKSQSWLQEKDLKMSNREVSSLLADFLAEILQIFRVMKRNKECLLSTAPTLDIKE